VHLDLTSGAVKDPQTLVDAIDALIRDQPQLAALLRWEERVLEAAADTIAEILGMTASATDAIARSKELGRLLARLAVEAVGEGHVDRDRFGAVSEALFPILADRVAFLKTTEKDAEIWARAFDSKDANAAISLEEAAHLNRMLHIAEAATTMASERGAVVPLPTAHGGEAFKQTFGMDSTEAALRQFGAKEFDTKAEQFRWMLVQTQAACDFAQRQPGPLPYFLALELPCGSVSSNKLPEAVWRSPPLHLRDAPRYLNVNCRFQFMLPPDEASKTQASYRLRDQLLSELVFTGHSYGARPGPIVFWAKKAKSSK
jgi:hypothetical protein